MKTYLIVRKITTKANGEKLEKWEAYRQSFLTRLGIYTYLDFVQYTNHDTYELCQKALHEVVENTAYKVISKVNL